MEELESYKIDQDGKNYLISSSIKNNNKLCYALQCQNDPKDESTYYNELTIEDLRKINTLCNIYPSVYDAKKDLNTVFNPSMPDLGIQQGLDFPTLIFYTKKGIDYSPVCIPLNQKIEDDTPKLEYQIIPTDNPCSLKNKLNTISKETDDIRKEHNLLRKEVSKIQEQTENLKHQNKDLQKQYNKKSQEVRNLELENERLKSELERLENEQNQLNQEIADIENDNNQLKQEIQNEKNRIKDEKNRLRSAQDAERRRRAELERRRREEEERRRREEEERLRREEEERKRKEREEFEERQRKALRSQALKTYKKNTNASVKGEIVKSMLELELISQSIKKKGRKLNFALVYKATADGDNAQDFHRKCDPYDSTVVLVETKDGKRFGGFTTKSWKVDIPGGGDKEDDQAFVFSLDKRKIYPIIKGAKAIGCYPDFGAVFMGCQIRIFDKAFIKGGSTYLSGVNYQTQEDYELTKGQKQFNVKEVEAYSVKFSN